MVDAAELVCSVAKVKWPVSAMRSADRCFEVAHFADENDSGLHGGGAEGIRERMRVGMNFTLIDEDF